MSSHPHSHLTPLFPLAPIRPSHTSPSALHLLPLSPLPPSVPSVRRLDPTGYLTTLFAPPSSRTALFVLRAFYLEVSRIPRTTSDPRIAEMKLHWWLTSLRSIYASPSTPPPAQPIVLLLHFLIHRHSFTQRLFTRILNARISDLTPTPPPTITALDAYIEATHSSLYYLFLQTLPPSPPSSPSRLHADHLASHVGKAVGITRLLQSLPHHASQRRLWLPASVMAECGVEEEAVWGMESTAQLQKAVFEMASNAKAHVHHGREQMRGGGEGGGGRGGEGGGRVVGEDEVRLLLDVVACERWLDALERVNFDVFDKRLFEMETKGFEPLKLRYALWSHARKGTF